MEKVTASIDSALFQENERTAPTADQRLFLDTGTFRCERGGELAAVTIAYETWGTLTPAKDNAVLICHALSGDSHAIGWWDRMVGPGKAFDTNRFFVIGTNALGGCQGSTGPSSMAPDGRPFGSRFPAITVRDMVDVQCRLVDHLGISSLVAVAGGSMGGMQALQWAVRHPFRVRKAFITAAAAAHGAMQIALNAAGREAIYRDPNWGGGDYLPGEGPKCGLAVARMIGHISFLSEKAFDTKFGRLRRPDDDFEVEGYLRHQGDKFTARFDANSFICLSKAIDWFECASLTGAKAEFLFTSFTSDWLYPSHQSEAMHRLALDAGCRSAHQIVDLPYGHDAFLLDGTHQGAWVREFLAS